MKIDNLLNRLDKVRQNGPSKWVACCPAHSDKMPSLGIKLADDDKILIHCFAGCEVKEIVEAVGLNLSDLMPESVFEPGKKTKPPRFNKSEMFDRVVFESTLLSIAAKQLLSGAKLSFDDAQRVFKAIELIEDVAREVRP